MRRITAAIARPFKDTAYLKATLASASSKLKSSQPADLATARWLDETVRSAESISSAYWAKIEPLYEPLAPELQLAVMHLNADIIAGQALPGFYSYTAQLVSELSV
jgi:hypothetical protein